MGLYLCIFDGDDEIDGVEIGPYSDFNFMRDFITRELEEGKYGSRFPTLLTHSDCDGEWSSNDCERLQKEIVEIIVALKARPPIQFVSEWQRKVAGSVGLNPQNAFESFIDVDGEFVLERLLHLAEKATKHKLSILFQ
jgi:hypothetical protein